MSVNVKCNFCGKVFKATQANLKRGRGKYCSKKCADNAKSKKITRVCQTCGKAFYVSPSVPKYGGAKFCCRQCYNVFLHGREPWNLRKISIKPSPELSYIVGVVFGDGTLWTDDQGNYKITLAVYDEAFAHQFNLHICKILGKKRLYSVVQVKTDYGIRYDVNAFSKVLYSFLKERPKLSKFEHVIRRFPIDFLKGFIDSEGGVHYKWKKNRLSKQVSVSNSSKELIDYVRELLKKMTIHTTLGLNPKGRITIAKDGHLIISKRDVHQLRIYRKADILRFYQLIGFSVKSKREKLERLVVELEKIGGIDPETGKRIIPRDVRAKISRAKLGKVRVDMIGNKNPMRKSETRLKMLKTKLRNNGENFEEYVQIRKKALELREKYGYGYVRVARLLGINKNRVNHWFRRKSNV